VKHTPRLLYELEELGVGDLFGEVNVLPLQVVKPIKLKAPKLDKEYRINDRLTVEEIYSAIDEGTHLTFDYMVNTFYAAMIAAIGLVSDSDATVVASMLISPLMGPIIGLTFGCKVRNWTVVKRCLKNEAIGAAITLLTGMAVGAVCAQFWGPYCENYSWNPDKWCFGTNSTSGFQLNSEEMISRGNPAGLIGGLFVALPAGGAGALAIMGGGNSALVGVAIAVALLPPLTNSGILFAMSITYYIQPPLVVTKEEDAMFMLCFWSFILFCMNFLCIFVSAYFMFYLKEVNALPLRSTKWRNFSEQITTKKRLSATGSFNPDQDIALLAGEPGLGRHRMDGEPPMPMPVRMNGGGELKTTRPLQHRASFDDSDIASLRGASLRELSESTQSGLRDSTQQSLRDSQQRSRQSSIASPRSRQSSIASPRSRQSSIATPRDRNNSLTPRERQGSQLGRLRPEEGYIYGRSMRSNSAHKERTSSSGISSGTLTGPLPLSPPRPKPYDPPQQRP